MSGCFDFHNVKRCQILASHTGTLLSQVYDSTLNLILKREEGVRHFNQVYYKEGATRERYFANIADNNRSEGIKLSIQSSRRILWWATAVHPCNELLFF